MREFAWQEAHPRAACKIGNESGRETMMQAAKKGDVVRVNYTLRTERGDVFASSLVSGPLEFTVGSAEVIKGMDEALLGMAVGESRQRSIPARLAFGEHLSSRVLTVTSGSPAVEQVWRNRARDSRNLFSVTTSGEATRREDYNHPLAGQQLLLDIELLSVSEIFPEALRKGERRE